VECAGRTPETFHDLVNDAGVTELPGTAPDFEAFLAHLTSDVGRGRRAVARQVCRTTELHVELRQALKLLDGGTDMPTQVESHLAVIRGNDAIGRLTTGTPVVRSRFE